MTRAERQFWLAMQRRASAAEPAMAKAILAAFDYIRDALTPDQIVDIVQGGFVDAVLDAVLSDELMQRAFLPVRNELYEQTARNVQYYGKQIPGTSSARLEIAFDVLSPDTITGIRTLSTKVFQTLQGVVREAVRQHVEAGIRDGDNPRDIARGIRDVVGLAPNQEQYVRNLRRELVTGEYADAERRKLLDRRFNLAKIDALSPREKADRINAIVDAYRKSYISFHAETVARTATVDALKYGNRLAWVNAADLGVVKRTMLRKRWRGTLDSRERPTHVAMENDDVPFDQPFTNGQMIPGDSEWNCRCYARYYEAKPR